MNRDSLIRGVSTHFRWKGRAVSTQLTFNKIYRILEWDDRGNYSFFNDLGMLRNWFGTEGVEDASFEVNLENILKE